MSDIEREIQAARDQLSAQELERHQATERAYHAEQTSIKMNSLLRLLNGDGLLLREAALIPVDTRHRIAGLIATFVSGGIRPISVPRVTVIKHPKFFGDIKFLDSEYVTGWVVRFQDYTSVHQGGDSSDMLVDTSGRIVASSDYRVVSARRDDEHLTVAKFSKLDNVISLVAETSARWVEPAPETYQ